MKLIVLADPFRQGLLYSYYVEVIPELAVFACRVDRFHIPKISHIPVHGYCQGEECWKPQQCFFTSTNAHTCISIFHYNLFLYE